MADFGNLSDTDDSAVDELISQIKDLSVLEQVSKINTSSFSDSLLPSHLDSRFQRLKSLPTPVPISRSPILKDQQHNNPVDVSAAATDPSSPTEEGNTDTKKVHLSPSYSPQRSSKNGSKLEYGPSDSPLEYSSISSTDSPSPPRKSGCFWCSPKKEVGSKTKKKVKRDFDWGKGGDGEYLSALSSFSVKEQEKILKKAVKEEERINREAEKIVKWAKQASSKLSFHSVHDEYSSDDADQKTKYP